MQLLKHRALPPETAPVAAGHGRAGHSRNLSDLFGGGAPAAAAAGVPLLSPKKAGHRRSGTAADELLNGGEMAWGRISAHGACSRGMVAYAQLPSVLVVLTTEEDMAVKDTSIAMRSM